MNSKASKQQIQWPPLLNLCHDRPHVDTTFRNWEENNSPYLNDMISPVYIKDNGDAGIYDSEGRKHQIIDGVWYVDGVARQSGYNYKFGREILDEDCLAYAINPESKIFRLWFDDNMQGGSFVCSLDGENDAHVHIPNLNSSTNIVDVRMIARPNTTNDAYIVALFRDTSGILKVCQLQYFAGSATLQLRFSNTAVWYKQTITTSGPTFMSTTNPGSIDPVINMYVDGYGFAFSIFSNYGAAVNSRDNYYITYYNERQVTSIEISNSSSYNKKVWYRGTATLDYSFTENTLYANALLDYIYHEKQNAMKYPHMWLYVDSSEAAEAGLTGGKYYRVWKTNSDTLGISVDGLEATTAVYVDPTIQQSELPVDEDIRIQYEGWTDTALTIYNFSDNSTIGSIALGGRLIWTWEYGCSMETLNASIAYTTDSNTLINPLDVESYFKFITGGRIYVTEASTVSDYTVGNDEFGLTIETQAGTGYTGSMTFIHDNNDFYIDFATDRSYISYDMSTIFGTSAYIDYETRQATTISTNSVFAMPNVFLDNGNMYCIAAFDQSTTSLKQLTRNTAVLAAGGQYSFNSSTGVLTISTLNEILDLTETGVGGWTVRSNSFICQQNYIAQMFKFTHGTVTPASLAAGSAEGTNAINLEIYNSNTTDMKTQPGSSRYTGFNYYGDAIVQGSTTGAAEDRLIYCTIGARTKVNPNDGSAHFNILFNTTTDNTCYVQGISWSTGSDYIGTLLTPWQEVSEDFYITANGNKCIFKNKYGEIVLITREQETPVMTPVNNNKFIICNTDNYWNLFDSERNTWFHYASDWNFRVLAGYEGLKTITYDDTATNVHRMYFSSIYTFWFRNIAATTNNTIARTASRTNFSNPNIYPVASWQTPVYAKARMYVGEESLYGANEPPAEGTSPLGIDVYYTKYPNTSSSGVGDAYYQYTYLNGLEKFKSELNNVTYTLTSSSTMFINPSLLATFLDGAGNNDLIKDLKEYYTQNYYNNKPTFIYAVSSEVNGASAFFVIQGQFYAIIENKICSVTYSDSILTSKDPIIDINGMKFIGNNTMIAFFWSERYRSFYSFTGDANLEQIYNGSKFSNISGDYYYDYSTQTIYVPTSEGLLCFGPKNTYILTQYTNTTNVQFTGDNITHITDAGKDYALVYYPTDGYNVNDVYLESSFFGIGATESTSIDRWNITLYDLIGEHPSGEVTVGVRSLTDITVKSEEKKVKITPDMWDKWSNSILITYNPKIIKAQGLRIYVDSPFIVQQITAHIMDNGTGTLSGKRSMV